MPEYLVNELMECLRWVRKSEGPSQKNYFQKGVAIAALGACSSPNVVRRLLQPVAYRDLSASWAAPIVIFRRHIPSVLGNNLTTLTVNIGLRDYV